MNYVVYDEKEKNVVKILKEKPKEVESGQLVATSDSLNIGDEFSYEIIIYDVTEDGEVGRYSAYKVAPKISKLLYQNQRKDDEIKNLKEQLFLAHKAIDGLIFGGGGEI